MIDPKSINTFDSSNYPLTAENIRLYTDFMRQNPQITRLVFSYGLRPSAIPLLASGISGHRIVELDLSHCKIKNWEGIRALLEATPHLTHLDLSYTDCKEGLAIIAPVLDTLPLENLQFSTCNLGPSEMPLINDILMKADIKDLSLHGNEIGLEGCKCLQKGVFRKIERLDLDKCGIDEEACVYIGTLLEETPTRMLSLCFNNIENGLAKYPPLRNLENLRVYRNGLNQAQIDAVAPLLQTTTHLRHLFLDLENKFEMSPSMKAALDQQKRPLCNVEGFKGYSRF